MSVAFASALAAQGAEISGQTVARTISGLSQLILESTRNVRVNRSATLAMLDRAREMADAVVAELENAPPSDDWKASQSLEQFEQALLEISKYLQRFAERSYFAQLLFHERDQGRLSELSDRLSDAYKILMLELNIQTTAMAEALSSQFADMLARDPPAATEQAVREPQVRLPPKPQLHFGRFAETQAVVDLLSDNAAAQVAILGGPGVGKTTLALAVLHHPIIAARFAGKRFFVACDSAAGRPSCLATIAELLGIAKAKSQAMQQGIKNLFGDRPALLVLDNFESAWEAATQRADAEQVLQFLDGLPNLSVVLALRGVERPQGMRWTRPFPPPLAVLSSAAAEQAFLTIANIPDLDMSVRDLLDHLGNLPLAIVLMANQAQSEPAETLLRRWQTLQTSMLTRGGRETRLSSLDASIRLSMESPRMLAVPSAQRLLSVLSLLPCGVVDTDLRLWGIDDVKRALSTLLQTSLASAGDDGRVHVLAPIRSFMLNYYPPGERDLTAVYDYYFGLAELARQSINVAFRDDMFSAVTPELSNLDSVIRYALQKTPESHKSALTAVVSLCILYSATGMGTGPELLPLALSAAHDGNFDDLRADLLFQWGRMAYNGSSLGDPESLYRQAHEIYQRTGNVEGIIESGLLVAQFLTPSEAIQEDRRLFAMAEARDNPRLMAQCAHRLAIALERSGDSMASLSQHKLVVSILERSVGPGNLDRVAGMSICYIAEIYGMNGDLARSVQTYEQAAVIFERLNFAVGLANIHAKLADTLVFLGRPLEAIDHASRVLAVPGAPGFRTYARCLLTLARAHILAGNTDEALRVIEKVDGMTTISGDSTAMQAKVLRIRGHLALALDDPDAARALFLSSRTFCYARDSSEPPEFMLNAVAATLDALCEVEIVAGRNEDAFVLAVSAAVLFRKSNNNISSVHSLLQLAEVADDDLAVVLLQAVMLPLQRMGHLRGLGIALLISSGLARRQQNLSLARRRAQKAVQYLGDVKDTRRLRIAMALADDE